MPDNHINYKDIPDDELIILLAKECYQIYGFYPISFSYHSEINNEIPEKDKLYSSIVPGECHTFGSSSFMTYNIDNIDNNRGFASNGHYAFDNEESYYNEYKKSVFGLTKKRGGWDCNRHLEIMANKCIPLFDEFFILNIPKYTMIHYPKKIFFEILRNRQAIINDKNLQNNYISRLTNHFNKFLTGQAMVKYMLNITGNSNAKNALFIDNMMSPNFTDYITIMTHNGLKMYFKQNCEIMYYGNHFLYRDSNANNNNMYGKGFTYSKKVPPEYKTDAEKNNIDNVSNILENIKNHKYDVIVYGAIYHTTIHLDYITKYYKPNEIIGLDGGDYYQYSNDVLPFKDKLTVFMREPEGHRMDGLFYRY